MALFHRHKWGPWRIYDGEINLRNGGVVSATLKYRYCLDLKCGDVQVKRVIVGG